MSQKKQPPAPAPETPRPSWFGKSLPDMTREEIVDRWPTPPDRPISAYSVDELVALKQFGPATIGGALYLAAQGAVKATANNTHGEAILSKSSEPVQYLSLRKT